MDRVITIVSLTRVLVSCVVGVSFGCISVVPTTVQESAAPNFEENKQVSAGSRLLSKTFSVRRCEIVHEQSVMVYLHTYNRNVQQNLFCAGLYVTNDLPLSPRFSSTIFYRDANSVLLRAHFSLYNSSNRLYA